MTEKIFEENAERKNYGASYATNLKSNLTSHVDKSVSASPCSKFGTGSLLECAKVNRCLCMSEN